MKEYDRLRCQNEKGLCLTDGLQNLQSTSVDANDLENEAKRVGVLINMENNL